jgi:hypothetical protein
MARIILATNVNDDSGMTYLGTWFSKVIARAKWHPDTVIFELKADKANKDELTEVIERENPQFVIFNGHGNDTSIFGFQKGVLIKTDDNEHLLNNKIVHSMACSAAKELGPKCISIGTRSFIGYKEKYWFGHLDRKTEEEQLSDELAGFFLDPAYEAIFALLEGATASEAHARSQRMYHENLRLMINSTNTDYNTVLASRLFHDLTHQVCLGDGNSKF